MVGLQKRCGNAEASELIGSNVDSAFSFAMKDKCMTAAERIWLWSNAVIGYKDLSHVPVASLVEAASKGAGGRIEKKVSGAVRSTVK